MRPDSAGRKRGTSMIENALRALFDFQRFEGNGQLEALIQDTLGCWGAELSDDQLEQVTAAGELPPPPDEQEGPYGSL